MLELSNNYRYAMDNRNGGYTLFRMNPNGSNCEQYRKGGEWVSVSLKDSIEMDFYELTIEEACFKRDKIELGE